MGKVILSVVAIAACLVAVESLTCNKCIFSVLGYCVNPTTETCLNGVTQCYTTTLKFPSVTNFTGFAYYGCATDNSTCGTSFDQSLLIATYTLGNDCCKTDKCNTITVNGATTTKMTFTAAILVSVLGSML